jgi:phage/plasmid-like protein (TIGR03299 family)
MAHNIDKMVYAGNEVPWHGLGTQLPTNADYEEIVQAAGFYKAIEHEISAPPLDGAIPDRKALFREDTGQYLATVHRSYQVIQFEEVAHTLVTAAGGVHCIFHTAGTLGPNGVRGWLLGELLDVIQVRGDKSPIKKYVLAYTGHDGITPIVIKNVATRVVCQNTVGVALGEQGAEWHINHTSNAKERLEEAGKAFRRLIEGYEYFAELANNLSTIRVSEHQLHKILDVVMPIPQDEADHSRLLKARRKVIELFHAGTGIEGPIRGTAWGALQAFTEYADHHKGIRATKGKSADAARLESTWMGGSAALKRQALLAIADRAQVQLAAA